MELEVEAAEQGRVDIPYCIRRKDSESLKASRTVSVQSRGI